MREALFRVLGAIHYPIKKKAISLIALVFSSPSTDLGGGEVAAVEDPDEGVVAAHGKQVRAPGVHAGTLHLGNSNFQG